MMLLLNVGLCELELRLARFCSKEEVLDERNNFELIQVVEYLVDFLLRVAIENQLSAEREYRSRQDRQYLQTVKSYYPIPQH